MKLDYKKMFDEAKGALRSLHSEAANLEEQQRKIQAEIEAATTIYNAVAPFVGEQRIPGANDRLLPPGVESLQAAGISVAIRAVLDRYKDEDFTGSQMRDRLTQKGWEWKDYKNPLSTVYTTLVRLADAGHAKCSSGREGKVFSSVRRGETLADGLAAAYNSTAAATATEAVSAFHKQIEKVRKQRASGIVDLINQATAKKEPKQ